MIKKLKESDISGLNKLPPVEWKSNYEGFLMDYFNEDFFHAFVILEGDEIVGTGNVLIQGKVGWLANIIVKQEYRGKGLGSKMTSHLVDFLKQKGCKTQLLIATDLGKWVYEKLGFKSITTYESFSSLKSQLYHPSKSIKKINPSDITAVCELDTVVNGEDRSHLIYKNFKEAVGYFNQSGQLEGYYLPFFGRGLVIATQQEVGLELLKLKHAEVGRKTLVPVENKAGIKWLKDMGLVRGERCTKMVLGKENNWKPHHVYSYGSGFCG